MHVKWATQNLATEHGGNTVEAMGSDADIQYHGGKNKTKKHNT